MCIMFFSVVSSMTAAENSVQIAYCDKKTTNFEDAGEK